MFLIDSSIKSEVVINWQTMFQWKNTTEFNTDKNTTEVFAQNAQNIHDLWLLFKSTYLIFLAGFYSKSIH